MKAMARALDIYYIAKMGAVGFRLGLTQADLVHSKPSFMPRA